MHDEFLPNIANEAPPDKYRSFFMCDFASCFAHAFRRAEPTPLGSLRLSSCLRRRDSTQELI